MNHYGKKGTNGLYSLKYINIIDLEPVYDPAPPPGGIFKGMFFLTLMIVGIHRKMFAKFRWGLKELWPFEVGTR